MKTKFLQRVMWLMIPLLTLFNTQAWGETITLTQSSLSLTGSYSSGATATVSNVTFTHTDLMKNSSNIQVKASSGVIYNSSLVPGKITKVQITSTGTGRSTTIAMGTSTSDYTAGSYSGNGGIYLNGPANTCCGYFKITRGSNAAYWTQVVITYTPATITLSKSSITGLDYAVGGGPSAAQTFTVSGSNIPANLTVTAPTNFEVSLDGSSWASSKTINVTLTGSASAGTLSSTTVYVRLASGKSAGNYSGNVSIAMAGCNTISSVNPKTVAVSGTVSAASCTTNPTVTAASNSSVTATTATVTCSSGISSLGSAGCSITDYGFVIGTSANPAIGGSGVTKHQVGTTYTVAGTSFSKNLTELSAETIYYVRPYATNGNGTAYGTQTSFTTPALPKYTVTLMDDGDTRTQASYGASVTLPTRTGCTGYTFAGWTKTWTEEQDEWTTTAPTIIPAGSYTPSANENLYPVYTKTESGGGPSDNYELYSGSITEGDYIIYYSGKAMNTSVDGGPRLQYEEVTPDDDVITTTDESIIWHIAPNGDYWTIYNADAEQYASSTGVKNQAEMQTGLGENIDYALWTVSGTSTYEFVNKQNTANSVNANLRNNGTYGFACYATSTGGALSLYKNVSGGSTTYYISVPNCCTDWSTPTVTYSSSLAINASEGVTIGDGTIHGAVTYESSDEDVLTVDADGTIHAVGAGTAHITATWAGDATYCEKSANSNDVTVSGIQVTGTTPVNFGQVYQNAVVANKTISVTGLGLASDITPSLPAGSPFSFSPASLAANSSNAPLTISASTATIGDYNQTLTLTSGAFSATVTVKMEVIAMPTATFTDALHGLTEDEDGVSLSSYNLTAAQGTPVVFPRLANQTKSAGTCEGEYYIFVGWTEGDNNTDPEAHLVTSYTLVNGDTKNYYAVWADASGSATYTKLTTNTFKTAPTKYVLGGEDNGTKYFLYTYSSTDADLSWGECSSSEAPIQFTLSGTAGALVAQDASGNYLAESSAKKKFRMSSTSATVQLQDGGTIETESFYLRYNHSSGFGGLRYYESESSEPAYFYEVSAGGTVHYRTSCCANKVDAPVVTATAVTSTSITLTWPSDVKATGWQIEWNGAGGWVTPSGSCTHTVSGLTPNTTYTWRVRATYEDPVCGADVRSGSTTTNQVYHVTYAKGSGTGTCTATGSTTDATGYEAGATVTLQENGFTLAGHTFAGWTEDDEDITISSNQFTMPDHDVVITASWTAKMDKYFDRMHDQTDALHGGVEETEGTNEGKYYIPKEGCSYSVPTAVDSKTGDACQTSHYKLRGWIAASYVNSKGEITDESKIFSPGTTKTAGGYTYYAVWAEVVE